MKYSMNLMTANPFSPSPGTTATAQFQEKPLCRHLCKGCIRAHGTMIQPFRVEKYAGRLPSVAAARQRWAG